MSTRHHFGRKGETFEQVMVRAALAEAEFARIEAHTVSATALVHYWREVEQKALATAIGWASR